MERKTYRLDLKAVDPVEGKFQGFLSTTKKDTGKDTVEPGAYRKTLQEHDGKVFLLDYHNPTKRLGALYLEEQPKGLWVKDGVLNMDTTAGREMHAELKFYQAHGLPLGMSIGYDAIKSQPDGDGGRKLQEVKLWEGSIVTWGMNPEALVDGVKSLNDTTRADVLSALKAAFEGNDPDTKAGRVLSGANLALVNNCMEALQALLEAATPADAEDGKGSRPEIPVAPPDVRHATDADVKALLASYQETQNLVASH